MNRRRGITLVELLATLSLLTIMSVVSVSWMTTVLRAQSRSTSQADWHRASIAVLDLIGQDVLTVDRLDTGNRSRTPRIVVEDNTPRIRTRNDNGVGTQRYILDPNTHQIRRQREGYRARSNPIALLGDTQVFECVLVLPSDERAMPMLNVSLVANDGREVHRAYILDLEDVQ